MVHHQAGKLRKFFSDKTFEQKMSFVTAVSAAVAAAVAIVGLISLLIGIDAYRGQERSAALERTHNTFADAQKIVTEQENNEITTQFPGRWEKVVRFCLKKEVAEDFLSAALHPGQKEEFHRYDLARKHLNQAETVAFQYVHGLVDQDVVSASACQYIAKTNTYFRHLIGVFRAYFGPGHSWQVIPQAVMMMRGNPKCISLPIGEKGQTSEASPTLTYKLPEPAPGPADWE